MIFERTHHLGEDSDKISTTPEVLLDLYSSSTS